MASSGRAEGRFAGRLAFREAREDEVVRGTGTVLVLLVGTDLLVVVAVLVGTDLLVVVAVFVVVWWVRPVGGRALRGEEESTSEPPRR